MPEPRIVLPYDEYYLNLLPHIAARSKDPSSQMGAVAWGPGKEIRFTGYNGFPRGVNDQIPERWDRPEKLYWCEHAERNLVYNAARSIFEGCTMGVSAMPCMDCARAIVQSGFASVIVKRSDAGLNERWKDHFERAVILFDEAKVRLEIR